MQRMHEILLIRLSAIALQMIYRKLVRLNIDIITHHIRGEQLTVTIVDQPTRSIHRLVLYVLIVGPLRQVIATLRLQNLPVVESAKQRRHTKTDEQEDEHLTITCSAQCWVHRLAPFCK